MANAVSERRGMVGMWGFHGFFHFLPSWRKFLEYLSWWPVLPPSEPPKITCHKLQKFAKQKFGKNESFSKFKPAERSMCLLAFIWVHHTQSSFGSNMPRACQEMSAPQGGHVGEAPKHNSPPSEALSLACWPILPARLMPPMTSHLSSTWQTQPRPVYSQQIKAEFDTPGLVSTLLWTAWQWVWCRQHPMPCQYDRHNLRGPQLQEENRQSITWEGQLSEMPALEPGHFHQPIPSFSKYFLSTFHEPGLHVRHSWAERNLQPPATYSLVHRERQ